MTATSATGQAIGRARERMSAGWPRLTNLPFVAPMAILVLLFFDLPLMLAFGWSIRDHKSHDFTLANYQEFFTSLIYIQIIWRTFFIAGIVSVSCAALAYPLAYWMSRLSPRRQLFAICCVVVPFWVSILVRTYAWIVVLGNGGIVNRWLQELGLTERPVSFLYNEFGVTLGMVNVLLPFLVLPLYAAMLKFDKRLSQVAATLGARERTIFWRVFFPVTFPALAAGMVLVFILSLGFFITPAILGGGKVPMIANAMDLMINRFSRWEMAAVVSAMLLAFTLTFYAFYQWLRART